MGTIRNHITSDLESLRSEGIYNFDVAEKGAVEFAEAICSVYKDLYSVEIRAVPRPAGLSIVDVFAEITVRVEPQCSTLVTVTMISDSVYEVRVFSSGDYSSLVLSPFGSVAKVCQVLNDQANKSSRDKGRKIWP